MRLWRSSSLWQLILLAVALIFSSSVEAANALDRESRFASVEAFISDLKAFSPSQTDNWLSYQFGAAELGQPEDPDTGKIVRPAKMASCAAIWQNEDAAVVFATARPATTATNSEVGMLFSLRRDEQTWRIAAYHRFEASGKYASLDCKLTAGVDTGPALRPDQVIVTITETQGGRGYSCQTSASFRVSDKITRVDLE